MVAAPLKYVYVGALRDTIAPPAHSPFNQTNRLPDRWETATTPQEGFLPSGFITVSALSVLPQPQHLSAPLL